jgi:hypothetical protein
VAALDWDADGNLWAVGAQEGTIGAGFYRWDGSSWHNHTRQEAAHAQMGNLAYPVSLLVDRSGWCWMTTWGYGLWLYRPDTDEILHFDSNSPPGQRVFGYSPQHPDWELTIKLSQDAEGNIWVVNNRAWNDSTVVVIPQEFHEHPDLAFRYLTPSLTNMHEITALQRGRLWLGAGRLWNVGGASDWQYENKNLLCLQGSDPERPLWDQDSLLEVPVSLSDPQYNTGENGGSGFISRILPDANGTLWVATTDGLYYLPGYLGTGPESITAFNRLRYVEGLSSENIVDLALDGRGRLWIAASAAVDVLDTESFMFVERYTGADLGLPLRDIRQMAMDRESGRLALLTGDGIYILHTPYCEHPQSQGREVQPYPNPFRPDRDQVVRFPAGQVSLYSHAIVYTLRGELIFNLKGAAVDRGWDGKDSEGRLVPPGVYLVLFYGQQGRGWGKIAVIR